MKIERILEELIIFARERECEDERLLKAAARHLDAVQRIRARRMRLARKGECERCEGPSTSGILCWHCLAVAPGPIRTAFRDAVGVTAMRAATEQVRVWIRTSSVPANDANERERRSA